MLSILGRQHECFHNTLIAFSCTLTSACIMVVIMLLLPLIICREMPEWNVCVANKQSAWSYICISLFMAFVLVCLAKTWFVSGSALIQQWVCHCSRCWCSTMALCQCVTDCGTEWCFLLLPTLSIRLLPTHNRTHLHPSQKEPTCAHTDMHTYTEANWSQNTGAQVDAFGNQNGHCYKAALTFQANFQT